MEEIKMKTLSKAKRFLVFLLSSLVFSIAYSPVMAFADTSTDVAGTVNSAYTS